MGVKVKKSLSKKAARSAAEREQAKKKPQPKSKAKPKIKEQTKDIVPVVSAAEASKVISEIREEVHTIGAAFAGAVVLDAKLKDALDRELWKYCDAPYKNRTAFVNDLRKIAGKSAATLFSMIGLQKALPESTAEQRREIGPRKGMKLAKAAKVAKKKGKVLPPEIIDKAKTLSESELGEELRREGFAEDKEMPPVKIQQDSLLHDSEHETHPYNPRTGGSGVVEGAPGTAEQFSSVIKEGIEAAQKIYDAELSDIEAMNFVFDQWLRSSCDKEGLEDMTNRQALAEMNSKKKASKGA